MIVGGELLGSNPPGKENLTKMRAFQAEPFQLPRVIILIESYDELSAAADRGVGKLRLTDTASPPSPASHLLESFYL